jgi:hypothetical protein
MLLAGKQRAVQASRVAPRDWLDGGAVGSSHSALGAWNCLMRQTFYRIKQQDYLFHGLSKQDQMKEGHIQQATMFWAPRFAVTSIDD